MLQTGLDIFPMAMFRSEDNFVEPNTFIPERWVDGESRDKKFDKDRREAFKPFSTGPRNCIGMKSVSPQSSDQEMLTVAAWHMPR